MINMCIFVIAVVLAFVFYFVYNKKEKFNNFYPDLENDPVFHSIQKTKHLKQNQIPVDIEKFTTIDASNEGITDGKIIINNNPNNIKDIWNVRLSSEIPVSHTSKLFNGNPYYSDVAVANSIENI